MDLDDQLAALAAGELDEPTAAALRARAAGDAALGRRLRRFEALHEQLAVTERGVPLSATGAARLDEAVDAALAALPDGPLAATDPPAAPADPTTPTDELAAARARRDRRRGAPGWLLPVATAAAVGIGGLAVVLPQLGGGDAAEEMLAADSGADEAAQEEAATDGGGDDDAAVGTQDEDGAGEAAEAPQEFQAEGESELADERAAAEAGPAPPAGDEDAGQDDGEAEDQGGDAGDVDAPAADEGDDGTADATARAADAVGVPFVPIGADETAADLLTATAAFVAPAGNGVTQEQRAVLGEDTGAAARCARDALDAAGPTAVVVALAAERGGDDPRVGVVVEDPDLASRTARVTTTACGELSSEVQPLL